ncbi:MAG: AsmA family protein [Coraliomargaritaceae bacterium]
MKSPLRIFLVLFILLISLAGIGYFSVTRPAFQKKLIESKLPAGSSIKFVRITARSIELTKLKLQLADGTSAKLESFRADFSPLALILSGMIELRGLKVEGLVVKLPEINTPMAVSDNLPVDASDSTNDAPTQTTPPTALAASSPTDALYALSEIGLLFDIDSIDLSGLLIDASSSRYVFSANAGHIAPGSQTNLEAKLKLESKQALQGGLQDFGSNIHMVFTQKQSGGFDSIRAESFTSGSDVDGRNLISITQTLDLSVNGFEETAEIALSFDADLPHPEVFAPGLVQLQGLSLAGDLNGSAEGAKLTLETADVGAASNGTPVATVRLKQALSLSAEQQFTGELMQVNFINLPLAWINPWLGDGMQLSGEALSAQIIFSGEDSGALGLKTAGPIEFGAFSLSKNQQPLLDNVTLRMNPKIRIEADRTMRFDLGAIQMLDTYGDVISGSVIGSMSESKGASPFAGLETKTKLYVGLSELLKQPAFAGVDSVLAGQAEVELDFNAEAEYPLQLKVVITGLRTRDLPGSSQDYRLAAQLKQTSGGAYTLGSNLQAGFESRPSTNIKLGCLFYPERQPLPFKFSLTSSRVSQGDIELLMASLVTNDTAASASSSSALAPRAEETKTQRPPWSDFDGEVSIKVDELVLQSGQVLTELKAQVKISEALLSVKDITATLISGELVGDANVAYDPIQNPAYQVASSFFLKNVDPSLFSKRNYSKFPVQGLFDGQFKFAGSGHTLEEAAEDSEGDLIITGRNGVLTAFELDSRSQLGLIGAGILGQSLNRPGITAMAQAVPYFKDMQFESFTLQLVRGKDKQVRIPELKLMGDNLSINGHGAIAAGNLGEILDQPLDLTLGLGAKGRLVDHLVTLQLLGTKTSEDGFRIWNQDIEIRGSLGDPDTSALKDLLNNAARRALDKPGKGEAAGTPTPHAEDGIVLPGQNNASEQAPSKNKEKSKQEALRDDIEMGLELINSIFG